jgi:DNA-binding HxlR family transcriptional regulator
MAKKEPKGKCPLPIVPPKVEYTLTKFGKSLVPVIKEIVKWGMTARHQIVLNQDLAKHN